MHRMVIWTACLVAFLFVGIAKAQSRLSIRAASAEPVDGWKMKQVEHCEGRCAVWVSPTAAITESDIEHAQPEVRADGYRIINVVFTDAGLDKMHDLTAAQLKKLVVLIVDDKVVWAPTVQYIFGAAAKKNVLTGNTPNGLTQEEVERIMAILR